MIKCNQLVDQLEFRNQNNYPNTIYMDYLEFLLDMLAKNSMKRSQQYFKSQELKGRSYSLNNCL